MNDHDNAIAIELQKNNFAESHPAHPNLQDSKAIVIYFPAHFEKGKIIELKNELSLYDELDYGNYE
jgi:hypothetical protein